MGVKFLASENWCGRVHFGGHSPEWQVLSKFSVQPSMAEYLFPKISLQQVQFITKFVVPIFGRESKYRFLIKLTKANDKRKAVFSV